MEPIKLSEDQKSVAIRSIKDICSAASFMHEQIKRNDLRPDMQEAIPNNLEHYLVDLCKAVGYDSDSDKKIKKRYEELKKANAKIHALEKQMGEQGDVDIVPKVLKHLNDKINEFWKAEGFGHISDCTFNQYGMCRIKFSGMLFPHRGIVIHTDTPESDKVTSEKWIQNLIDRGFQLIKETEKSRHLEFVIDNDSNRNLIISTITKRFPSAKVIGFSNHLLHQRTDIYSIRNIGTIIYDIADI